MNGKDIFLGMKYIDEDLIQEAEFGTFSAKKVLSFRRSLLAAALIALTLLLVGCAVVYVLNLQGLTLGNQQREYDSFSDDGLEYLGTETVTEQVLTLAGIQGSPAYTAAQEWFDFTQAYDPDLEIKKAVWGNYPEFPEEYYGFDLYTQEMKDKLDEIRDKYGLKLPGKPVSFQTTKLTMKALGMEDILLPDSGSEMTVDDARYYQNGNLDITFNITLPDGKNTWGSFYLRKKDAFIGDTLTISGDSWQEQQYTTSTGHETLILRSPDVWVGWIFCDMGDSTAALRFESIAEVYSDDGVIKNAMTDRQVEMLADSIDFSLKPQLAEGWETMTDGAVASGETINGYTIYLKNVETDGYSATITLGITAPEGTILTAMNYRLAPGSWTDNFFTPVTDVEIVGSSGNGGTVEDGDGLDHTIDYLYEIRCETADGSMAFGPDSIWRLYFEDIYETYWDSGQLRTVNTLLAEGTWDMEISFADGDFRELELLDAPITAKACTGWRLDGTDVLEELEITSIRLRSHSADISCEQESADFLCFTGQFSYVVMKDGTTMEFYGRQFPYPVDLDEVAGIRLADGTYIPVPGTEPVDVYMPTSPASDVPEGLELLTAPMEYHSLAGYAMGSDNVEKPLYEVFALTSILLSEEELTIFGTSAFHWPDTTMQLVMEDGTTVLFTGSGIQQRAEPPMSRLWPETPIDLSQADHLLLPDGTKVSVPH